MVVDIAELGIAPAHPVMLENAKGGFEQSIISMVVFLFTPAFRSELFLAVRSALSKPA